METISFLFFFLLGTILGSFYTVIGLRLPLKESFWRGRSHCDCCHHPLKAGDLVPLLSFLFLRGKCRYCKAKITPLSFFIELFTGLLFMIAYYSFGFSLDLLLMLLVISMAMILLVSDLVYMILPDEVLLFFGVSLFFVQLLREGVYGAFLHLGTSFFLFLFMYALMCLGNFLFKKESLGGGDIKLLFIFGLVLDPILGVLSVFLGSFIALPVSLFLLHKNREHVIPFGPFLLIALLLILFSKMTSLDILSWLRI